MLTPNLTPNFNLATRLHALASAFDALSHATRDVAAALETEVQADAPRPSSAAAEPKRSLPSLDDLRHVKAKNVSWQQLIRGGRADLGFKVEELRKSDKSHARRVARDANVTIAELVQVLEAAGIAIEE
ncbi:hypothetical protein [Methylobacterium oxalidis]|uniref:Uncharacterized protein n=1 Tax=Methylobacterium oxalidis TaxID=944322 RepID=A0A512JDL5_9HYPH|nr:hypothetical protein [Methylobacterium oxalidis]GEP08031.1 hypothetical protein MOX02_60690 [Methylobacterium oxalidis]GJE35844.1 hypothetical protein LDDCCGHA_6065 [Methylobacterium oxalidis]GLS63835.1 hypothetical protein GCM10007888_22160 [Methylobacterium oxalidis]